MSIYDILLLVLSIGSFLTSVLTALAGFGILQRANIMDRIITRLSDEFDEYKINTSNRLDNLERKVHTLE